MICYNGQNTCPGQLLARQMSSFWVSHKLGGDFTPDWLHILPNLETIRAARQGGEVTEGQKWPMWNDQNEWVCCVHCNEKLQMSNNLRSMFNDKWHTGRGKCHGYICSGGKKLLCNIFNLNLAHEVIPTTAKHIFLYKILSFYCTIQLKRYAASARWLLKHSLAWGSIYCWDWAGTPATTSPQAECQDFIY